MAGHPQNSPRGLFSKKQVDIAEDGGVYVHDYSTNTAVVAANSTGPIFAGQMTFTDAASSLPGNVDAGIAVRLVSNSTGVAIALNTSGTAWKFLNVTSAQPT